MGEERLGRETEMKGASEVQNSPKQPKTVDNTVDNVCRIPVISFMSATSDFHGDIEGSSQSWRGNSSGKPRFSP